VLDAQYFGVPQRRRRVFIVGCLGNSGGSPEKILAIAEGRAGNLTKSNEKRKDPTYKTSDGAGSNSLIGSETVGSLQASDYKFPQQQQVHENKIVIQEVARLQAFGDYQIDEISSSLLARDYKGATDLVIQPFVKIVRSGARAEDGSLPAEVWAERETAPTLNVMDNNGESHATVLINDPTFFYAKTHQDVRIQGETINTLQASMGTGGGNTPMVAVATAATVRRLTPTECERLQGFPDGWTDGQADSHRYKQMGNAVAVPVIEWIINRIIK
jgi:DNA (cytosine-5)-methyltransferase 1